MAQEKVEQEGIRLFYSYSSKDEAYREQLETHLSILRRRGVIAEWHFRKISPGSTFDDEIHEKLDQTELFLVLVSSDFLASDYCYEIELQKALRMREEGLAQVIPIILRPVDLEGDPLEKLQFLPTDGKPVSTWGNVDEAWLSVARGIRLTCNNIQTLRPRQKERSSPTSTGDENEDTDESEQVPIEDLGVFDFVDELETGMQVVSTAQNDITSLTEVATDSLRRHTRDAEILRLSGNPNIAKEAKLIAGRIARDLSVYASKVDPCLELLRSTWDRNEEVFIRLIDSAKDFEPDNQDEIRKLRNAIGDAKASMSDLRESVLAADDAYEGLGRFAAVLKSAERRIHDMHDKMIDVYWQIENSMEQMILRIDKMSGG